MIDEGAMDIFHIVRSNDEKAFDAAIDTADLNAVDSSGLNRLHYAVARKSTKFALELVRKGINVNHRDSQGQTPLHYAATHQDAQLMEAILKAGGNVSILDVHGNSPLWAAVVKPKRNLEIVRMLVDHGGDPNRKNKAGKSPLEFAKQLNSEPLISLLSGGARAAGL
jgi:ankyrin repeat protein